MGSKFQEAVQKQEAINKNSQIHVPSSDHQTKAEKQSIKQIRVVRDRGDDGWFYEWGNLCSNLKRQRKKNPNFDWIQNMVLMSQMKHNNNSVGNIFLGENGNRRRQTPLISFLFFLSIRGKYIFKLNSYFFFFNYFIKKCVPFFS